jgi:hypothetical protein
LGDVVIRPGTVLIRPNYADAVPDADIVTVPARDLAVSVARLVDIEAIKQVKYRYMRAVDLKDWDLLAGTLEEDVTAHYGRRLDFADRAELLGYFRENLGPEILTVHHLHQPEITVDGDDATGSWALRDQVIIPGHDLMITGACFYDDTYRRGEDGEWRIATTAYERLFEATETLDVRTDFRLVDNRWADNHRATDSQG